MERITEEKVAELAKTNYFDIPESPACVSILPFVKEHMTGAEIGVFMGTSSVCFLEHCQFMHFIDPCYEYEGNPDKGYFSHAESFLKTMEPYQGRFTFHQSLSSEAALNIPELDFAFIDGNHTYPYVKQDIELFWPKIKKGGFLSGHDYNLPSVSKAVQDFFFTSMIEIHQRSWLLKKPEEVK